MKLNLIIDGTGGILAGYLNIDPFCEKALDSRIQGDISNLDKFIDDGECEEIRAFEVISYFEAKRINEIVNNWISKLGKGGLLTIIDIDLFRITTDILSGKLDIEKSNMLLYGLQEKEWQKRKCILTMQDLCENLKAKDMIILEKIFSDYRFIIKAKKK